MIWCLEPNRMKAGETNDLRREAHIFHMRILFRFCLWHIFDLSASAPRTASVIKYVSALCCCVVPREFRCRTFSTWISSRDTISLCSRAEFPFVFAQRRVGGASESWESCNFPQPSIILSHRTMGEKKIHHIVSYFFNRCQRASSGK